MEESAVESRDIYHPRNSNSLPVKRKQIEEKIGTIGSSLHDQSESRDSIGEFFKHATQQNSHRPLELGLDAAATENLNCDFSWCSLPPFEEEPNLATDETQDDSALS